SQFVEIWQALMQRLLAIDAYKAKFAAAFPSVLPGALGFQHAATAIAAFQMQAFTKTDSPFDRYLNRDDAALPVEAKRGALLFFGKARCSQCHSGPFLGASSFSNAGVPQLGADATINADLATLDFRLRTPLGLTDAEQRDLVAFLKALTDPAARDLTSLIPATVPSGLPVEP